MTQTETVRVRTELVSELEQLIKEQKDEFGIPIFRSLSDAATEAVKDFLKKHKVPKMKAKEAKA